MIDHIYNDQPIIYLIGFIENSVDTAESFQEVAEVFEFSTVLLMDIKRDIQCDLQNLPMVGENSQLSYLDYSINELSKKFQFGDSINDAVKRNLIDYARNKWKYERRDKILDIARILPATHTTLPNNAAEFVRLAHQIANDKSNKLKRLRLPNTYYTDGFDAGILADLKERGLLNTLYAYIQIGGDKIHVPAEIKEPFLKLLNFDIEAIKTNMLVDVLSFVLLKRYELKKVVLTMEEIFQPDLDGKRIVASLKSKLLDSVGDWRGLSIDDIYYETHRGIAIEIYQVYNMKGYLNFEYGKVAQIQAILREFNLKPLSNSSTRYSHKNKEKYIAILNTMIPPRSAFLK